ncbi:MAG: hypothetical protein HC772_15705 [Leptolyngbyaceae cyanobacterium CRU_2_3]|nr:hypothetical protein [Leptolyngbyaceae cyanobacterium CRU_2_3]
MKLTFRDRFYEFPAPSQLDNRNVSTDQTIIKLIYRGRAYNYTPPLVVVLK